MKKNFYNFLLVIMVTITAGLLSSCVNLHPTDRTQVSPAGLIPKDFDWKTVKELTLTIRVPSVAGVGDNMIRIIKIYNSALLNDGALMASGAATPSSPYVVTLTLATALPTIYIQEILPTGERVVKTVDVSAVAMSISFSASAPVSDKITMHTSPAPTITIPTNYDVTLNNQTSLTLTGFASGQTSSYGNTFKSYYIPSGYTRTGAIDFGNWQSHAILYVKGIYRYSGDVALNNATIVVLDGGRVEVSNISTGTSTNDIPSIYVQSGGTLVAATGIQISNSRPSVNKGTMTINDDFTVSTNITSFYNEGTLTVTNTKKAKTLFVTNSGYLYNNGTINSDLFSVTTSATLMNDASGTIQTTQWYQTNNTINNNYGHIVATTSFVTSSTATINNFCQITSNKSDLQGATFNLADGSIFTSQTLTPNNIVINMTGGSIFLTGTMSNIYNMQVRSTSAGYSLFKCTGNIPDLTYAASGFNGKIEVVHTLLVAGSSGTNGSLLYPAALFTNGAILSKTQTKNILATTCNGAAGQIETPPPSIIDVDGDGVAAGLDYDDNDPNVAFASYFPSASTWGTYAFEDLWPVKGDYDVNDLILGFKITYLSNASNLVTSMRVDYNLRAAGGNRSLATAFQLDLVSASNINSVTGQTINGTSPFAVSSNGAENGVSLAVIPLFNTQKDVVTYDGFLNTIQGTSVITPDKYVTVKFNTPVQQANLAVSAFNMFIVVNDRGCEIHLPSYNPTSKFNQSLTLGASLFSGNIYKYIDGMMWGIMIPDTFLYPSEQSIITSAYLHFGEWATSGGTSYPDWYMQKTGYTNAALIY